MPPRKQSIIYQGILIRQRPSQKALPFFVFAADAAGILKWATVERTEEKKGGAQRMLYPAHQKALQAYIEASELNIIPTAVTLTLLPKTFKVTEWAIETDGGELPENVSFATLEILCKRDNPQPGRIVDGQHRLFALESQPVPLVASVILGANRIEQALHFIIINNKGKRVHSDLVKSIYFEMTPAMRKDFDKRTRSVRITLGNFNTAFEIFDSEPESPFRGLIAWEANRKGPRIIRTQALEGALREIMTRLDVPSEKSELDEAVPILMSMWSGIRSAVTEASGVWEDPELKLLKKAGFVAATEFVVERLNQAAEDGDDVSSPEFVEATAKELLGDIPLDFWLRGWKKKGLDTGAGRLAIREAMKKARKNTKRDDDPFSGLSDFLESTKDGNVEDDL